MKKQLAARPLPLQVRTHAVLADRVRPGKAGLHTRASAGSTASSGGFTWPEGQARSGGEGAMSPGELSAGSSEAGLSYNRVPSLVRCTATSVFALTHKGLRHTAGFACLLGERLGLWLARYQRKATSGGVPFKDCGVCVLVLPC